MKPARSRHGFKRVSRNSSAKTKYHPLGGGLLNSTATPPLASPLSLFPQRGISTSTKQTFIVRLARDIDLAKPCCENIAHIEPGRGPHAGGLRCAKCGKWRGWIPAAALEALVTGAPTELPVLRTRGIILKEPKPAPAKSYAAQLGAGARQHHDFFSDEIPFAPEWRG
jgi:hypothetical protein